MSAAPSLRGRVDAVVIGTSAGGVEALTILLPSLPVGVTEPIFIVLHLPRDKPSVLAEIFRQRCALRVEEAEDKMPVQPGTVYFAPADYHLLLDKGPQLSLSADEPVHFSRPSIDVLFESAADVYRERLLGIILTGANEDGARGLAAVHLAGGVTMVQEPASAQSPVMAESALKRTTVDYVLPLSGIAALLATLK
jgi:two-component system, chemotaxis family, protein-glutamate methylesterase/glutaminase